MTDKSKLRLLYIIPTVSRARYDCHLKGLKKEPSHLVVVLGSGGHSGEMVSLLRDIDPKRYKHRTYVMSSGDDISAGKAEQAERTIQSKHSKRSEPSRPGEMDDVTGIWDLRIVPRAREIHQPLYTTPLSAIRCLFGCLKVLNEIWATSKVVPFEYPDVIITNGPATAVMFILAAVILKFFGVAAVWKMKIIYIESFARIHALSLSGKVLLWMGVCDAFLVQWEGLAIAINGKRARKKVDYRGFLV